MLKRTDILDEILQPEHYAYLRAFKCFDVVVLATFGYELDQGYHTYIAEFEQAWRDTGLSVTTKLHLVFEHLSEACDFYGCGMALLNESAAESVHADFHRHYQGYIVKDLNSEIYQRRLLHAVKTYNANHI